MLPEAQIPQDVPDRVVYHQGEEKGEGLARGDSMDDYALNCPLYRPLATSLFEQLQSAADGERLERIERRVRSIDRRMEPHAGRLGTGFFGEFR